MKEELDQLWHAYEQLFDRCRELEELADRMIAGDPTAADDFRVWKGAGTTSRSP